MASNEHDQTAVSRSRPGHPSRGDVVAGRYELEELLVDDSASLEYRAVDRTTGSALWLRLLHPDLSLTDDEVAKSARRLEEMIGIGGRFLPGLLDAGRDGARLFTVEALPTGTCLVDSLRDREAESSAYSVAEALSIVAQLQAAVAAVPPGWIHGEIRPSKVWIDPVQTTLTGPFLFASLPPPKRALAFVPGSELLRYAAPEMKASIGSSAADLFGLASVTAALLAGRPCPRREDLRDALAGAPKSAEVLYVLLAPQPASRPPSISTLLRALGEDARIEVPRFDPAPISRRVPTGGPRSAPPPVAVRTNPLWQSERRPSDRPPAPRASARPSPPLPSKSVRPPTPPQPIKKSAPPPPMRVSQRPPALPPVETLELSADDLEAVPVAEARRRGRQERPSDPATQKLVLPADIKPIPRPATDTEIATDGEPPLFDDSVDLPAGDKLPGRRSAPPPPPAASPTVPAKLRPAAHPVAQHPAVTALDVPTQAPPRSGGWGIILAASLIGVLIIAVGLAIAAYRNDRADQERREQERVLEIQRRLEELRREESR